MYLFIGFSVFILALLLALVYLLAMFGRCYEMLGERMPLNEWISFDEAVRLGDSSRWITHHCLYNLGSEKRVEIRPSPLLREHMNQKVKKLLESLSPDNQQTGVLFCFDHGFKDVPQMEFLLRFRPNGRRKIAIEKEYSAPEFALPHAI